MFIGTAGRDAEGVVPYMIIRKNDTERVWEVTTTTAPSTHCLAALRPCQGEIFDS